MRRILKWTGIVFLGLIALGIIGNIADGDRPAQATRTPSADISPQAPVAAPARPVSAPKDAPWQTIKTWSGSGIKQTESFQMTSREWRVKWAASDTAQFGGILQIYVYDDKDQMVTLAANVQGAGQDESYVRAAPGRFHLMINSANLNWAVAVEAQQ